MYPSRLSVTHNSLRTYNTKGNEKKQHHKHWAKLAENEAAKAEFVLKCFKTSYKLT